AATVPETVESGRDLQTLLRSMRRAPRSLDRGEEIVVLDLEASQPQRLIRAPEFEIGARRDVHEEVEVAIEDGVRSLALRLLARLEQVVTPLTGGGQRAVVRDLQSCGLGEQAESIGEPGVNLLDREHANPRRGELDRQRHPVEAHTDVGHGGGVLLAELEPV